MAKSKLPPSAERRSKKATKLSKVESLMAAIAALSEEEREDLLDRIEFEYPSFDPTEIPAWHMKILKKRLADAERNPDAGIPLEDFLDELRAKR
jgi:hypothetical protein